MLSVHPSVRFTINSGSIFSNNPHPTHRSFVARFGCCTCVYVSDSTYFYLLPSLWYYVLYVCTAVYIPLFPINIAQALPRHIIISSASPASLLCMYVFGSLQQCCCCCVVRGDHIVYLFGFFFFFVLEDSTRSTEHQDNKMREGVVGSSYS